MPTPTYTPIANITLASPANTVTFSSISQAYRDLILITNVNTSTYYVAYINGDSGSNYYSLAMSGNGSTPSSGSGNEPFLNSGGGPSNATTSWNFEFLDYSATDKHKTILQRITKQTIVQASVSRWASTAAITTIKLDSYSTNPVFGVGSTFALYGIAA